jgi:hypothetical protein
MTSYSSMQVAHLWGTRILSVCPFAKYTFPLLDGVFTHKLLLPYRKVGQQQRALMVYPENFQLWHLFLAKSMEN